jgi:hypothetical protein
MNLWNDLVVGNDRVVSREEIEFEIAVNDELLERREALIWRMFTSPDSALPELESLYQEVLKAIEERGDE